MTSDDEKAIPKKPGSGIYRLILGVLVLLLVAVPIVAWLQMEKRGAEPFSFRADRNVEGRAAQREHQERLEEALREIGPIELESPAGTAPLPSLELPEVPSYPSEGGAEAPAPVEAD